MDWEELAKDLAIQTGAGLLPYFQGDVVIFSMMARFLRLFSRHGGSLSSSKSGADRSLSGALPSF
jgi:hypothetical protein